MISRIHFLSLINLDYKAQKCIIIILCMLPCLISTVNKNAQKVYPLGYTFRQIIDDTYPQILVKELV